MSIKKGDLVQVNRAALAPAVRDALGVFRLWNSGTVGAIRGTKAKPRIGVNWPGSADTFWFDVDQLE